MAIRKTPSGTYQVYWRNPITKKQEARNFKTLRQAKKENSLIQYRISTEPESFKEVLEEKKSKVFLEVYEEYLAEKKFPVKQEKAHRKHLCHAIELFGNVPVKDLTKEIFCELQKVLDKTDLSQASKHNYLTSVRTVFYYACNKGYCTKFQFPTICKANYQQFVPPTDEELQKLLDNAPDHLKRVIILGAYLGVRVGVCELFQLTWEDVDFSKCLVRVHGSKKNKNAPYREVPIQKALLPIFQHWSAEDKEQGYLIHYRGKPIKSIINVWKTTLKKAGITRRIRPYDLRHAFGTNLIAGGVDVGTVAKLMGHSNPTMLLTHYQYILEQQKRDAVEVLFTVTV